MGRGGIMTSIIIVTYNRLDLIKKCLAAVTNNAPKDSEIIIVDNNSSEGVVKFVKDNYPKIKVLANKKNTGFAVGNNQGVRASKGDNLLFLNTDAFLEPNTIEILEQFLDTHPDAGAVAPQLRNSDGSIQPSGGFFPHLWQIFLIMTFIDNLPFLRQFTPSIHIRYQKYFEKVHSFDWLAGACLLVRREVFEKTGGFDENLFMYGEELEWCYRIKKASYEIFLNPAAQLVHLGFASSPSRDFGIIKEMVSFKFFYKKHKPAWQFPILMALMTLGCLLRILRGLVTLNPQMIRVYSQSLKNIFKN